MTNAASHVGLDYGGTDLQTDPIGLFIQIRRGLYDSNDVRGEDVVVPALPGRILLSRENDTRRLVLEGEVMGLGADEEEQRESLETQMWALKALFDPTETRVLTATLPSGAVWTINARTLNMLVDDRFPTWHRVNIELESVDPDWAAAES